MLRFIDLNKVKHAIDITKVTNVANRLRTGAMLLAQVLDERETINDK